MSEVAAPEFTFKGPWFSSREAAAYVTCPSLDAWYSWRRRHGIIPRGNGSVAKKDLDRELTRRPSRRGKSLASLANLRKPIAPPTPPAEMDSAS